MLGVVTVSSTSSASAIMSRSVHRWTGKVTYSTSTFLASSKLLQAPPSALNSSNRLRPTAAGCGFGIGNCRWKHWMSLETPEVYDTKLEMDEELKEKKPNEKRAGDQQQTKHVQHHNPDPLNYQFIAAIKKLHLKQQGRPRQRVWVAAAPTTSTSSESQPPESSGSKLWSEQASDFDPEHLSSILENIQRQETQGARFRTAQQGVLHKDPSTDMHLLTKNYTVHSLASALRDREDALQNAAVLAAEGRMEELRAMLNVYHPKYVLLRRGEGEKFTLQEHEGNGLSKRALEKIRKTLMRMPRPVTQAHSRRAGVVIALCDVDGVPSILFEKRSSDMRAHADEVCLPGGMYCSITDKTIVETCLREMREEIFGLPPDDQIAVLGVFRCNWGEVHQLVGVAVTPVVVYLGSLPETLTPSPDEVAEIFTIPLARLLQKDLWVRKDGLAPIFLGGPHVIWGLTGYVLDRFYSDILLPNVMTAYTAHKTNEKDGNTEA